MEKTTLALLAALLACSLYAEKHPFERYQSIIDRQPFGQPPPGFDPTVPAASATAHASAAEDGGVELSQEQEALKKAVVFSVINVGPDGATRVGFSDRSDAKAPRHYYMRCGETRDGWTVKSADLAAKTATLEKGSVEISLTLGGGASGGGGDTPKAAVSSSFAPPRGGSPLLRRQPALGGAAGSAAESHHSRREKRLAMEAAEKRHAEEEAKRKAADDERKAKEAEAAEARERELEAQRQELNAIKEQMQRAEAERKAKEAEARASEGAQEGDADAQDDA